MNELPPAVLDGLHYIVFHLASALFAPIKVESFLYWPFLVSSGVIVVAVAAYWRGRAETTSWTDGLRQFGRRGFWLHPSARADYGLWLINALIVPAAFGIILVDPAVLARGLGAIFVFGNPGTTGGAEVHWVWRLAFTVTFFVAYDFGRFVAHSAQHDIPWLWHFHQVHHSAEVLTPMTAFRVHPVDLLLMGLGGLIPTALVTLLFNAVAGLEVTALTLMGLNALVFCSNLVGNLHHSPVWISYGNAVGHWLISPAHHQLHHSYEPQHLGCNRGFQLAIWDRLYGTLYVPPVAPESYRLGLDAHSSAEWHSVWVMLWRPIREAFRSCLPVKSADRAR